MAGRKDKPAAEPLRVVRVGGSLLTWPNLKSSLTEWLGREGQGKRNVLIAGGGQWVEQIRESTQRLGYGDEEAHWRSIQAMGQTARLLSEMLQVKRTGDLTSLRHQSTLAEGGELNCIVLETETFLRTVEPLQPGNRLPASWDVTSDSIAARVAEYLNAELVLLKSADCPAPGDFEAMARLQYVDRFFPIAAEPLCRIQFTNLRSWQAAHPA